MNAPAASEIRKAWSTRCAVERREAPVPGGGCRAVCGAPSSSSTLSRTWALRSSGVTSRKSPFVAALGALTGNQAMQRVRAGLDAIYLSGWQAAGMRTWLRRCPSRSIPVSR